MSKARKGFFQDAWPQQPSAGSNLADRLQRLTDSDDFVYRGQALPGSLAAAAER